MKELCSLWSLPPRLGKIPTFPALGRGLVSKPRNFGGGDQTIGLLSTNKAAPPTGSEPSKGPCLHATLPSSGRRQVGHWPADHKRREPANKSERRRKPETGSSAGVLTTVPHFTGHRWLGGKEESAASRRFSLTKSYGIPSLTPLLLCLQPPLSQAAPFYH